MKNTLFISVALICLLSAEVFSQNQRGQRNEEAKEQIEEITKLLKANKLEECIEKCSDLNGKVSEHKEHIQKYNDLCAKQLVSRIRKLPKNKINTPMLASIYYDKAEPIIADIIQNDGRTALASAWPHNKMIMVQISGDIIGECDFIKTTNTINGYGNYLGNKTTTVNGSPQYVPNYQLLWCSDGSEGNEYYTLDTIPIPKTFSAANLMNDKNFAKDIDQVMKNVAGLQTSGKTELGGRRGAADGDFNDGYAEGGFGGLDGQLGNLMGGGGGSIGTKSKDGIKAPGPKDIEINEGSRSKPEIMAVINARMSGLNNLYKKYLKLKPGFSGNIVLKLIIAPGGDIIDIYIVSTTTGYAAFDNAIEKMIYTWKWKVINSGNSTVTIQFSFAE
ncbi:MAG: AgmX/PglI C-terminal domain-containing protein [Fibromonadaceae bacterium]|nr:AgmX/PglI C-terminal domain-containing protein [Fibromonadaceae bacterium]